MAGNGGTIQDYYHYEQDQDQDRSWNNTCGFFHGDSSRHHAHVHLETSCNNINGGVGLGESCNYHQVPLNKINLNPQERVPIGLTLRRSSSLINQILALAQEKQQKRKVKAVNMPAVFLRIGSWKWTSRNEGDLVVKFYYGRKKLVWEFLYGSLKKKMEIQWSQVSAINALVDEDKKGRLQIELNKQPEYGQEVKFQAGKHTQWATTDDVTGGQAPICRRHTVVFSPGVLDEPFKKLLQCDNRLLNFSRQLFPTHNSPLFRNRSLDFSYNRSVHECPSVPIPDYDHRGALPAVPISSYDHRAFLSVPISSYGHQGPCPSVPISNYGHQGTYPSVPITNYDHQGTLPLVPISNYDHQRTYPLVVPISDYDHQGTSPASVPISDYDHQGRSSALVPISDYDHQGTFFLPYVQNLGHSSSNLPMADLKFPNSDEVERRVSYVKQRTDIGVLEQSGNMSQVQDIPFTPIVEKDHDLLPYNGVESWIQDQQLELHLTDDRQSCFTVDSTCKPFKQKYQNEFENGGNSMNHLAYVDSVDQSHVNSGLAFEEQNYGLPIEAQARIDGSSSGGSHMTYLDDEIFSLDEYSWLNDGLAFKELSS